MMSFSAIELAEIRQAELLQYAEEQRLARFAAAARQARKHPGRGWRNELTTLIARISAMRRPPRTMPADLAPAAETT